MKNRYLKFLLFSVFGVFCLFSANAASTVFSNYGQIQNVQNYSTNPFWTPTSPYNQRMPQPVYVQGAALNTEDCVKVVQSLVYVQCSARDNCKNTSLDDIRPAIMVQLSNLPGNNYVSACAGYLDGVYESYVAQYGNNAPTKQVAFPTATAPNQNVYGPPANTIQIQNPYQQVTPQWQQEINERSQELQQLQQQNAADSSNLSAVAFPTTYSDLSFTARMANAAEGYAPYKDMKAYRTIEVKSEGEWCPEHTDAPECAAYRTRVQQQQQQNQQNNDNNSGDNQPEEYVSGNTKVFRI